MSTDAVNRFLTHLRDHTATHGVELVLSEQSHVLYPGSANTMASGFFIISPQPKLAVGMGRAAEQWLEVLIHESCHMDQWQDDCLAWRENFMPDGREAVDWLNDWCEGRVELSCEQLAEVIHRAKQVEMDCESRTLDKILEWSLPVDRQAYAQRANAYVHFYDVVGQTRAWNQTDQAPYELEHIWQQAASKLTDTPNQELLEAYRRQYIDVVQISTRSLKPG